MPDEATPRLLLPRSARLQKQHEFARVRAEGQRLARGSLLLNWMPLPEGSPPRLGVVTSRKLGKAHVRSRARRLMREAFRRNCPALVQPAALVLVARQSIVGRSYGEVERDFLNLLQLAKLLAPQP